MPEPPVMIMCFDCGAWSRFEPNALTERVGSYFMDKGDRRCQECGSGRLDWQSIISEKTYNPTLAKARSARRKKKR